jgi:hypothetical protein
LVDVIGPILIMTEVTEVTDMTGLKGMTEIEDTIGMGDIIKAEEPSFAIRSTLSTHRTSANTTRARKDL